MKKIKKNKKRMCHGKFMTHPLRDKYNLNQWITASMKSYSLQE